MKCATAFRLTTVGLYKKCTTDSRRNRTSGSTVQQCTQSGHFCSISPFLRCKCSIYCRACSWMCSTSPWKYAGCVFWDWCESGMKANVVSCSLNLLESVLCQQTLEP